MKYTQSFSRAVGLSMLALASLTLLSNQAVEAALIGDTVELQGNFQGDDLDLDFLTIEPATQVEVVDGGSLFTNGIPDLSDPNLFEFLTSGSATDGTGNQSQSSLLLNLQDDFIEGVLLVAWDLSPTSFSPFRWEYTLSDLDWLGVPDREITGLDFSFTDGGTVGTVTGCIGQS
ncbi:MAG: hypothetical protein AAGF24_11630, partial [Cyanobacteria bacterium P01_H01_bin.121]